MAELDSALDGAATVDVASIIGLIVHKEAPEMPLPLWDEHELSTRARRILMEVLVAVGFETVQEVQRQSTHPTIRRASICWISQSMPSGER